LSLRIIKVLFNTEIDLSLGGLDNRTSKLNQFYLGFIRLYPNDKNHLRILTPLFQLDIMRTNRGLI